MNGPPGAGRIGLRDVLGDRESPPSASDDRAGRVDSVQNRPQDGFGRILYPVLRARATLRRRTGAAKPMGHEVEAENGS